MIFNQESKNINQEYCFTSPVLKYFSRLSVIFNQESENINLRILSLTSPVLKSFSYFFVIFKQESKNINLRKNLQWFPRLNVDRTRQTLPTAGSSNYTEPHNGKCSFTKIHDLKTLALSKMIIQKHHQWSLSLSKIIMEKILSLLRIE